MNTFELEIVTPEQRVFAGEVQSVQVPGTQGSFQVLYNHAPIISTLTKGHIKVVKSDGSPLDISMKDGVIEVLNNKAIVLVESVVEP